MEQSCTSRLILIVFEIVFAASYYVCLHPASRFVSPAEQLVYTATGRAHPAGNHPAEQTSYCGGLAHQRGQHTTEIQACMKT